MQNVHGYHGEFNVILTDSALAIKNEYVNIVFHADNQYFKPVLELLEFDKNSKTIANGLAELMRFDTDADEDVTSKLNSFVDFADWVD